MRIIIVGGGVIGSIVTSLLAKEGHDVVLIDAGLQTPRVPLIHSKLLRFKHDIELARISEGVYEELSRTFNVELTRKYTTITILPNECFENNVRRLLGIWSQIGIKIEWLSKDELRHYGLRSVNRDEIVLRCENADCLVDVRRIIRHARKLNVNYIRCKAELSLKNDRVKVLCKGEEYDGDYVVLACGAWNSTLLRRIGVKAPLRPYKCQAIAFLKAKSTKFILYDYTLGIYARPLGTRLEDVLNWLNLSIIISGDGNSPVVEPTACRGVDEEFKREITAKVRRRFIGIIKSIEGGFGFCEGTPDTFPLVGLIAENAILIGGFNGYGAEIGPALAKGIVEFLKFGKWPDYVRPYLITRFKEWPETWDVNREAHDLCAIY